LLRTSRAARFRAAVNAITIFAANNGNSFNQPLFSVRRRRTTLNFMSAFRPVELGRNTLQGRIHFHRGHHAVHGSGRVWWLCSPSALEVRSSVRRRIPPRQMKCTACTGNRNAELPDATIVVGQIESTHHAQLPAALVDQTFFVATRAYQVTACSFVGAAAETTAATLRVQVTKDTSTNAPGAGVDLLTNNGNAGFDVKATANTVQTGTLTGTAADLKLAVGDRLSVDYTVAATEGAGITITCSLQPTT
jgi:hypothetical protein